MSDLGRPVPQHGSGPVECSGGNEKCVCGDYRHQHRNGSGECLLGSLCTPYRCLKFRLWHVESEA